LPNKSRWKKNGRPLSKGRPPWDFQWNGSLVTQSGCSSSDGI